MNRLLEGMDSGALLQRVPSNVRMSLETLERAGTDWNDVGSLLAATPTAGVSVAGTGQWTSDLWQAVKWEFRSFLCTESEPYADLRKQWGDMKKQSPAHAIESLATRIASRLGVSRGVIVPLVTWLFVATKRVGCSEICLVLSATSASALPRRST